MQLETLLLRGLFALCALLCGFTLAAMVTAVPASSSHAAVAAAVAAGTAHARIVG